MIKRIIACILACCIAASCTTYTFASNLNDIREELDAADKTEQSAQTNTQATTEADNTQQEIKQQQEEKDDLYSFMQQYVEPTNYLYFMFNQVVELYVQEHLHEFTREQAIEKFIYDMIEKQPVYFEFMLNTLLGTMDKYSALHDRESGYMSVESPNSGYGIVVSDTGESVVINKVLRGSNAEKAGLRPGDKIVSVMGIDVTKLTWNAVSFLLRSPHVFASNRDESGRYDNYNPEIDFVVDRNGLLVSVKMTRGIMTEDELTLKYYEDEKVAYIGITSFIAETLADDFYAMLREIKEKGYKKLIIDLRDNGGGSLDIVIDMVEHFVGNGETLCYFNSRKLEEPEAVISSTSKLHFDKISVLINENTASAAELMASILKNKADAVLVGKTSFGKALGQSVYTLATGDYITITTYEVLDSNGESYNDIGLVPELVIDNVELMYTLPELMVFNHMNYKEIAEGVYSDACMALEQRLEIIGLLRSSSVDGIWDKDTQTAILILQRSYNIFNTDGHLDDVTVTVITNIINGYKDDTYYEDSQFEVAMLYHSSLSQAKRLIKEKEKLAEEQQKLIKERQDRMEAELAAAEAEIEAAKAAMEAAKATDEAEKAATSPESETETDNNTEAQASTQQ